VERLSLRGCRLRKASLVIILRYILELSRSSELSPRLRPKPMVIDVDGSAKLQEVVDQLQAPGGAGEESAALQGKLEAGIKKMRRRRRSGY